MKKKKKIIVFVALIICLNMLVSGVSAMAKGIASKAEGTASISAVLFEDLNLNGKQEADEAGIEGITVRLLDDSGEEITKTLTNKEGKYTFDKLSANMYRLKIDYPTGYVRVTNGPVGLNAEGLSGFFDLEEGETFTDAWVGFNSTDASIAGTIFNDENKNGVKDATEKGIAGIELGLYVIGSSTPVQSVKTNATGTYTFSKITPNKTYEIKPMSIPSQYEVIKNSNFDENGKSIQFSLKSQDKKTNINLALFENILVSDIDVEPKELIQYVGDTGKLKVTITPDNATNKDVTFTSANPEIMTVDKEGNWVAKAIGTTIITVNATNGKKAYVVVIVKEILAEDISVEPKVLDQYVGDTGKLKVTITPDNTTNKDVTFTSANPEIMTVDKEGNWVAKSVGETTITVKTSNEKLAIVKVIVRKKQGVGATFFDYPRYLGYFIEKGVGTATNFDDDYNNVEPYPGLGTDYYKVKKVGYVTVKDTGMYTFSIEVDDNGAVYLDNEKIIDRDNIIGGTLSNFRHLKAGQTIKITTEHYNKEAPVSYFHLRWQTPSNPYSPKKIPDSEITMD